MQEATLAPAAESLDRRDFTTALIMAVLSGATIVVSGCGGSDSSPAPSPSPSPGPSDGSVNGAISGNHGHVATITSAQLQAGNAVSLDIRGAADHPHTVDLSAQNILDVAARRQVVRTSTNNSGHDHRVTFN
jgi:hypothetical protein